MSNAYRDENSVPTLLGASSSDGYTPVRVYADPVTHRLLVSGSYAGINTEVPTGAVNGSNVTYTFQNTPKVIVVDQSRTMKEDSGWSLSGLTATLDVAPMFEIYSIY